MDRVDVSRETAGINNRVDSRKSNASRTLHTPKGAGGADERGHGGGGQQLGHHDDGCIQVSGGKGSGWV
jgi:hypothetical protein